jgi:hypothetical protein
MTDAQRQQRVRFSVEGKMAARAMDAEFERTVLEPYNSLESDFGPGGGAGSVDDSTDPDAPSTPASYLADLVEQYMSGSWVLPKDQQGGARSPTDLVSATKRAAAHCTSSDLGSLGERAGRQVGTALSRSIIGVLARITPNDVKGAWRIARRVVDGLLGTRENTEVGDRKWAAGASTVIALSQATVLYNPPKSIESRAVRGLFALVGRKFYSQQLLGQPEVARQESRACASDGEAEEEDNPSAGEESSLEEPGGDDASTGSNSSMTDSDSEGTSTSDGECEPEESVANRLRAFDTRAKWRAGVCTSMAAHTAQVTTRALFCISMVLRCTLP